eukprot:143112-Chlamydomonas_euryale.AAC.1
MDVPCSPVALHPVLKQGVFKPPIALARGTSNLPVAVQAPRCCCLLRLLRCRRLRLRRPGRCVLPFSASFLKVGAAANAHPVASRLRN